MRIDQSPRNEHAAALHIVIYILVRTYNDIVNKYSVKYNNSYSIDAIIPLFYANLRPLYFIIAVVQKLILAPK